MKFISPTGGDEECLVRIKLPLQEAGGKLDKLLAGLPACPGNGFRFRESLKIETVDRDHCRIGPQQIGRLPASDIGHRCETIGLPGRD